MATVALEHLEKIYPSGVRAVDDFSLTVGDGELVALVGPSGCGKTTTLRLIAGLEPPTRGTIALGGRVVNGWAPRERNVALVFQQPALYPHLTVRRNLAFPLVLRRAPRAEIERRVADVARVLGIGSLLDRRPRQLSGGQQQRVALGRALVRDPACFLLDEPLAHLDTRLRQEMRTEIKRLHAAMGTTLLFVTHDQEEALVLGRRVAVMYRGRIQQIGTPTEVYRRPANRFVAAFLGSPPMNFLEGAVIHHEGRLWFDADTERLGVPDWAARALAARVGARAVLGVRPEAISRRPWEGQSHNSLNATVVLMEPLGGWYNVHLATERHAHLVARTDTHADWQVGQSGRIYVDLDRVDFFAPEAEDGAPGRNLCV